MVPSTTVCVQESPKGQWPQVTFCDEFKPETCKLHALQTCHHHFLQLGGLDYEGNWTPLLVPGPSVCLNYVLAITTNEADELYDCSMEVKECDQLTFKKGGEDFIIEAEVKERVPSPSGSHYLVTASKVDCVNNYLPSSAGKLTFLLAADSPREYNITIKLRSVGSSIGCGHLGVGRTLDEISRHFVTHYYDTPSGTNMTLSDFCDGHSLPSCAVEHPLSKRRLMGQCPQVMFCDEFKPETCKLHALQTCRHHLLQLGGLDYEGNWTPLLIPGPYVCINYVLAIATNKEDELYDCSMEVKECDQLTFKKGGEDFIIEAEVKERVPSPSGSHYLVTASKVDCVNNYLPSSAGKLTFLLAADSPREYNITIKLRSVGSSIGCGHLGVGRTLDEISRPFVTHFNYDTPSGTNMTLSDFCDGHSLPSCDVEHPLPKRKLMGILGKPVAQVIRRHFQDLVENGAHKCFKRDLDCFLEEAKIIGEQNIQDLILEVQLERALLLYQMGDLKECKRLCEDVCAKAKRFNPLNENIILGHAKFLLSSPYKQEKDFSKAKECLDASTELLAFVVPGEHTATNLTCLVALLSEKASVFGISQSEKIEFEKARQDVLRHYGYQLNHGHNRNARAPRRSIYRQILFYLRASRSTPTDMQVALTGEELKDVERLIDVFERNFLKDCPLRDKALFFCARFDLLIRLGKFPEAEDAVSRAWRIAEMLDLPEEMVGARDRLQLLNLLVQKEGSKARRLQEITVGSYQGYHEPHPEVLAGYLRELRNVIRSPA